MKIKEILNTSPKLLLVSKFTTGNTIEDITNFNGWEQVLGDNPRNYINQLLALGILVPADLEVQLSLKCSVEELKKLLKQRGLRVAGSKDILVKRLVEADPEEVKSLVGGLKAYKCSDEAKVIADQYLSAEKDKSQIYEDKITNLLKEGKLKEACLLKAKNEISKVFPLPRIFYGQKFNYNECIASWSNYDPGETIKRLEYTLNARPKILSPLNDEQMNRVCFVAALGFFMDKRKYIKTLPDELNNIFHFNKAIAVGMVEFYGLHRFNLEQWRNNINIKQVKILHIKDELSCDVCHSLDGKILTIDDVPELPNKDCTSIKGCRCEMLPTFK